MRVISGTAGGLKLTAPRGMTTRPTTDRVKEALFSILEHAGVIAGAKVLDLFAGSGSLGIEALSRGAATCTFIEKNRAALDALQTNITRTRYSQQATVLPQDALRAVERLAGTGARFRLALIDPPYDSGIQTAIISYLSEHLMEPDGMIVAELSSRSSLPQQIGRCNRSDRRVYGDTALEFYIAEATDAP